MSTDDRPSISTLRERIAAMDAAPWYSSASKYQPDCIFTGGTDADMASDARVVVQANPNFAYRANLDGIVDLRNTAPVLLEVVAAALAYEDADCCCEPDYRCEDSCPALIAHQAYYAALAKVRS